MVRLTFICHASTEAIRRAAFPRDEPLEAKGMEDATALAGTLPSANHALTSPARRARETADCLALAASVDSALTDLDYGRWAGLTLADLAATEREAVAQWMSDPAAAPHGGESIEALFTRVAEFLSGMSHLDSVIAVTHAPIMRAAVALALDAPPSAFWRVDIAPLARVTLHGEANTWRLRELAGRRAG